MPNKIINILPKDFQSLEPKKKEDWKNIQYCFDKINEIYKVRATTKPSINKFHLFSSKIKPLHFLAWSVSKENLVFKLSLIQYVYMYPETARHISAPLKEDKSFYFFGQLYTKTDFGICYVRPETLRDKFIDIVLNEDIDFDEYPKFSNQYYVVGNEKEKILNSLSSSFFYFIETIKNI